MKSFIVVVAMLVLSVTSAFASEGAPMKLNDAQLDGVSAGFFNININISPVISVQTATAITTQLAVLSSGYQAVLTNVSNFAETHLGVKQ